MRCFKCNEVLTKESHCPNCGIDVSMYKKAVMASNVKKTRQRKQHEDFGIRTGA